MKNSYYLLVFIFIAIMVSNCSNNNATSPSEPYDGPTPLPQHAWTFVDSFMYSPAHFGKVPTAKYNNKIYTLAGNLVRVFDGTTFSVLSSTGFNSGTYNNIWVKNENEVYISYRDGTTGNLYVRKFNGTFWEDVNSANLASGSVNRHGIDGDESGVYVAYPDQSQGGKLTVKKYNGSTWDLVGQQGFSIGAATNAEIAVFEGKVYVIYEKSQTEELYASVYDGAGWNGAGTRIVTMNNTQSNSLEINDGEVNVSYADVEQSPAVVIKRLDGSVWKDLGSPESKALFMNYDSYGGKPIIIYKDNDNNHIVVKWYNGSIWEQMGFPVDNYYIQYEMAVRTINGIVYAIYEEGGYVKYYKYDMTSVFGALTATATSTITPTATITLSSTISATETGTPTITVTPSASSTQTVTPTMTPTPDCNFGFGHTDSTVNGGCSLGFLWANSFTASGSMTVNSIFAYIYGSAADYCVGIYSDNAGEPGTLLAESGVQSSGVTGWVQAGIPDTTITSGSTYWLVFTSAYNAGGVDSGGITPTRNYSYSFSSVISSGLPANPSGWDTWASGMDIKMYTSYCY